MPTDALLFEGLVCLIVRKQNSNRFDVNLFRCRTLLRRDYLKLAGYFCVPIETDFFCLDIFF